MSCLALATVAVMAVRVLLMVLIDGLFYGWYWSWGGFVTSVLGLVVTVGGLWVLMYLDGQQALVGKSADQLRQLGYDLSDAMKELRFTGGNQNTSGQRAPRPQYQSASADYGARGRLEAPGDGEPGLCTLCDPDHHHLRHLWPGVFVFYDPGREHRVRRGRGAHPGLDGPHPAQSGHLRHLLLLLVLLPGQPAWPKTPPGMA